MNDTPEKQVEEIERLHHYLVAGEVMYTKKDKQFSMKLDCMIMSALPYVNRTQIARAQQALQVRMYDQDKVNPSQIVVTDVFVYAISYLGHMSKEEFAPPIPDEFMEMKV